MNHKLHAQQFSGFIPQESLELGAGLGNSASFKIDDLLICASLTCSDGLREILSFLLKKIVYVLKTVITKWCVLSSLSLVTVRDMEMVFGFLL